MLSPDLISQYVPFLGFNADQLAEVAEQADVEEASKGTLIFKRGKTLSRHFFLLKGEVNLINNQFGAEKVVEGQERALCVLNTVSPTSVSAIAKSRVTFFSVDSEVFERLSAEVHALDADNIPTMDDVLLEPEIRPDDDWMASLLALPLFRRVSTHQLQKLFSKFEKVIAHKGDVIVKEGASGDYFYVLGSGTAHVSNITRTVNLDIKTGGYFGEEALVTDACRNATVVMTSDGVLERLSADDFKELLMDSVIQYIEPNELEELTQSHKLLDVRIPIEYRMSHYPESINIPVSRLRDSLGELANTQTYVVIDDAGCRAEAAAHILCQNGFDAVILHTPKDESGSVSVEDKIA